MEEKTDKEAIIDRGWFPGNRRLLTDSDILKTKVTPSSNTSVIPSILDTELPPVVATDSSTINPTTTTSTAGSRTTLTIYEQNDIVPASSSNTISTATGAASSAESTIETQLVPSPSIDLLNVNFEKGLAGEFIIDILQHIVRKEKDGENLNTQYEQGQIARKGNRSNETTHWRNNVQRQSYCP